MSPWPFVKLGSLADFKNGLNFSSQNWGRGLKVIGVTDFQDYSYPRYDEVAEINPSGVVREADYLEEGDVLFVRSNGNPNLIGRTLFIKGLPEKMSHSGFTIRLRFKTDKVFRPFYVYLFKSCLIRAVLSIYGGGTNINNLNQQILANLDVPAPPFATQQKIAALLSAYDELIENNRRRIALLDNLAEDIYREWFVRLRFPSHEKVRVLKGIPEGWDLVKLEHAFKFTGGGTPSKEIDRYWTDGDVNWFTPSDITGSDGIFLERSGEQCTEDGYNNSSAKMFPPYSVMLTSRATIGAIGINLTPACTNQGFITCIPNARYPLPYLYHFLKLAKPHFELLSSGATFAELTKGTFKRIDILTPPEPTVAEFARIEAPLFKAIENHQRANRKLMETRDKLLPRLISGKLSVENLDIKFPPGMAEELKIEPTTRAHA